MLAALAHRNQSDEQEQLLRLYWNRAGVKRELVGLQREHYDLLEKLEQQSSEIMRAQSQLEGLERLLTDPAAAANAMVYFQLRHMWRLACLKLEQFSRELKTQREKRERKQLHSAILAKRERRQQAVRVKLQELLSKRKAVLQDLRDSEHRLESMNFLVKLFAGPPIKKRIQACLNNRSALEERIREFNEIVERIQGEPLPEPEGLTLESRRLINVAVIAFAQHLVLHFEGGDLARLARKASKRSVADMKFGDRRTCDQMVEHIRERIEDLNRDRQLADHVKTRADALVGKLSYRYETDATPMRAAVSDIPRSLGSGRESESVLRVNVLDDDYWELSVNLY